MAQIVDHDRRMRIDEESVGGGYFKHAVYNHWDPYGDIPDDTIVADRRKIVENRPTEEAFYEMQQYLALFGAGEESVTEDLGPLLLAMDDIDDQMFVTSQIYDEAKHTQFFERYWREVILPATDELGYETHYPTEEHFFVDEYVELFDRTEEAMERLLTDDTPENRVRAYCHYHLAVESVLAQTGYYGFTSVFSQRGSDEIGGDGWSADGSEADAEADGEALDALVTGISYIRQDEGRHVGFGMQKVQRHLREDDVDEAVVHDTLTELLPLIASAVSAGDEFVNSDPLVAYASEKLTRRIEIMTDFDAEIPPVEELVALDDEPAAAD